jgi:hypothetical protein
MHCLQHKGKRRLDRTVYATRGCMENASLNASANCKRYKYVYTVLHNGNTFSVYVFKLFIVLSLVSYLYLNLFFIVIIVIFSCIIDQNYIFGEFLE